MQAIGPNGGRNQAAPEDAGKLFVHATSYTDHQYGSTEILQGAIAWIIWYRLKAMISRWQRKPGNWPKATLILQNLPGLNIAAT